MAQEKRLEKKEKEKDKNKKLPERNKDKREKDSTPRKIIIRRLPPSLTAETLLEQISPVPEHDYFYFAKGSRSLGENAFSRAYINFNNLEDIIIFQEKFDNYIFLDSRGNEFPAIVEFAPFQRIPKKKLKKNDPKKGSIDNDPDYLKFLETLTDPGPESIPAPETFLEEIEIRDRELKANHGVLKKSTPLIDYIQRKREEKKASIQRAREDRKRKELERKRQKEEERRKRKEKERERQREKERQRYKEKEEKKKLAAANAAAEKEETEMPKVTLLKNPEREKQKAAESKSEKGRDEPKFRDTGAKGQGQAPDSKFKDKSATKDVRPKS